jgi:multisubunit Na+/H+ antiporter MnhB subunit
LMFTVFGLLMALVWARLGSPDLALAEAAIGAGLTGAMLLLAYRRLLQQRGAVEAAAARRRRAMPAWLAGLIAALAGAMVIALGIQLYGLPKPPDGARDAAWAALPETGVGNPVTAVLILFRGWDTLLEMVVLLAAWLGVATVQPVARPQAPGAHVDVGMVDALLAAVVPSAVLVGGYLLHAGGQAPGGAFQGGAVLAAAGVLLALSGRLRTLREPLPLQRFLLVAGIAVFAALGLVGIGHAPPLALPGKWAVYVIEGALMLSIALGLLLLFLGASGVRQGPAR